MPYKRITSFEEAEKALKEVTGTTYPDEYNAILERLATAFTYKIPEELTKLLFNSRIKPRQAQSYNYHGFESDYSRGFSIALKLLQAYAIELSLESLDEEKQKEFIAKFNDETYLSNLRQYPSVNQIFIAFVDLDLARTEKSLALKEEALSPETFSTDDKGKLQFLEWFLYPINDHVISADTMEKVKKYADSLSHFADPEFKNLLNQLYALYFKPEKMFAGWPSAQEALNEIIRRENGLIGYDLGEILKLLNASDPSVGKMSILSKKDRDHDCQGVGMFRGLLRNFDEYIAKFKVGNDTVLIDNQKYPIAKTMYQVLDQLADILLDEPKVTLDNAYTLLGFDAETLDYTRYLFTWKLERDGFEQACVAFQDDRRYKNMNTSSREVYEDLKDQTFFKDFLRKYKSFRAIKESGIFSRIKDKAAKQEEKEESYTCNPDAETLRNMLKALDIVKNWSEVSLADLRRAYHRKAMVYHPDKALVNGEINIEKLNELFTQLTNTHAQLTELKERGYQPETNEKAENKQKSKTKQALLLTEGGGPNDTLDAFKEEIVKKAQGYLKERSTSTWLIMHGFGPMVQFFSPIRYTKIVLTLKLLSTLDKKYALTEELKESSTAKILNCFEPKNDTDLSVNFSEYKEKVNEATIKDIGNPMNRLYHSFFNPNKERISEEEEKERKYNSKWGKKFNSP